MQNGQNLNGKYVQIDKYVYDQQRPLGSGACGTVYLGLLAKEQDENEVVAIKEIPVKASHDITDSILQEVNVLRKLKHRNIVTFIDAKMNDEFMYLITQFCNQGTIEDLVKQQQLTEEELLGYFFQILEGLKYTRSKKIVHRDIKPQNILIHNGVIKIADFGLAKVVDTGKSKQFQTFSGTPLFMSPQIIKQQEYTEMADIWSLGVTFYYMLFKQYPWNDPNPLKLLKKIEKKVDQLIPDDAKISLNTQDLLQRMLVIEEQGRITWEELFVHKAFNLEIIELTNPNVVETIEDITVNSLFLKQSDQSKEIDEQIQELGRRKTIIYFSNQNQLMQARHARDHIEFERQSGLFLIQVAKELESQKNVNSDIPEDLYVKCMFLLFKRIYALFLNLNQMLMFETNASGIIEIDQADWNCLMKCDQFKQDLKKMRNAVVKDYDFARKEFSKWKDQLYDAKMNLVQFNLIERGDAYQDSSIVEDHNLILATNDNFLRLFLLLANELEIIYMQALDQQISISKNQIFTEKKIDFVFVYDLIIVLAFRNIVKKPPPNSNQPLNNFHKYYEDRKRIDAIEILHRIYKQKCQWQKLIK